MVSPRSLQCGFLASWHLPPKFPGVARLNFWGCPPNFLLKISREAPGDLDGQPQKFRQAAPGDLSGKYQDIKMHHRSGRKDSLEPLTVRTPRLRATDKQPEPEQQPE